MRKVDDILVTDWWDVFHPGNYSVSVSRRQPLPGSKNYVIIRAPEAKFRILAD